VAFLDTCHDGAAGGFGYASTVGDGVAIPDHR
jgi:hypothetical protein